MCCGSKRQQFLNTTADARPVVDPVATTPAAPRTGIFFTYEGATGLVVIGRPTGRRYRFAERGARLAVDPVDATAMTTIPKLRRVAPI